MAINREIVRSDFQHWPFAPCISVICIMYEEGNSNRKKKQKVHYKLAPPDYLIVGGVFVLQQLAGKVIGDVYEYVKRRLKKFYNQKKAHLSSQKIQDRTIRLEHVEQLLDSEESLEIFVKYTVKYLKQKQELERLSRTGHHS